MIFFVLGERKEPSSSLDIVFHVEEMFSSSLCQRLSGISCLHLFLLPILYSIGPFFCVFVSSMLCVCVCDSSTFFFVVLS